jgi:hypothetical protein
MHTTIGKRRRILKLWRASEEAQARGERGASIKEIAGQVGVSYYQAYNVVRGRVKVKYSPRSDYGRRRRQEEGRRSFDVESMDHLDDFLMHQLTMALEDLNVKSNIEPAERVKILKDIAGLEKARKDRELERYLKRPDAILIARIMRRFNSTLTDDDVIRIFKEESTRLAAEAA